MQSLNTLLGGGLSDTMLMAIIAAAALVGLLIILWLFKMIFSRRSGRPDKHRPPRLSVTDAAVVDDKRRLVLVRRDDVEHLVMIGGPSDIVVESNIIKTAPHNQAVVQAQPHASPAIEPTIEPTMPKNDPAPVSPSVLNAATTAEAVAPKPTSTRDHSENKPVLANAAAVGSATGAGAAAIADSAEKSGSSLSGLDSNKVSATQVPTELAGDLENALGMNDIPSVETPSVETPASETVTQIESASSEPESGKTEDEMQRLLDELAVTKN